MLSSILDNLNPNRRLDLLNLVEEISQFGFFKRLALDINFKGAATFRSRDLEVKIPVIL